MFSKLFYYISIIRSYLFCFKYLPFSIAKKCPILIHWRVKVYISPQASIKIYNIQKHSIKIGMWGGSYGLSKNSVTQFNLYDNAHIFFNGKCTISKGSNIVARGNSSLVFGENFFCNSGCKILANKAIYFGNDTLMGWNITILDSDGHQTVFKGKNQESSKEIYVDDHCWIGAESSILKGVRLDKNTIIPYGSVIHKSTNGCSNTVFNNKVLKEDIEWIN